MKYFAGLVVAFLVFTPLAAGVVVNEKVPVNIPVFVDCADGGLGEIVVLSGNLHFKTTVTIDQNGGLHVDDQTQPQGLSGEGLTTGDKYQGTGITRMSFYGADLRRA